MQAAIKTKYISEVVIFIPSSYQKKLLIEPKNMECENID